MRFIVAPWVEAYYCALTTNLDSRNAKAVYLALKGDFSEINTIEILCSKYNSDNFNSYIKIENFKALGFTDNSFLEWNEKLFSYNNFKVSQLSLSLGSEDLERIITNPDLFVYSRFFQTISLFSLFHKNESTYRQFISYLLHYFDLTNDFFFKNFDNRNKYKIPDYVRGSNDDPYREILEIICLKRSIIVENGFEKPYSVSFYYPNLKECNFVEMLKLAGCNDLVDFYIEKIYKRAWKYLSNHKELFDLKYLEE